MILQKFIYIVLDKILITFEFYCFDETDEQKILLNPVGMTTNDFAQLGCSFSVLSFNALFEIIS